MEADFVTTENRKYQRVLSHCKRDVKITHMSFNNGAVVLRTLNLKEKRKDLRPQQSGTENEESCVILCQPLN